MANNTSIYGSGSTSGGNVSSSNYTTLYSGGGSNVPAGDNVIITGTLTVNGCSILTDCSTFSLLPFNATTINFGGSSTAMSIGSGTGVTTIQNQLSTGNYLFPLADGTNTQILATDGAGVLYWTDQTTANTTYTIDATATTGGTNFNLVGSDATTDTIKFANGTGMSIVRTDANTITFTNTAPDVNTTYTIASASTTGGANLNLVGSDSTTDSVAYKGSGATTVVSTDANTITISSTDTNTTYTQNASSTTGGANLNLVGCDSTTDPVKFACGSGISVVRTDADTITITNTDPGSAGVTSITGTANQVIASSSTGAVTLSLPQNIATTSTPTFGGVVAGLVDIGTTVNNVIKTTPGSNSDLILFADGTGQLYFNDIVNIGSAGSFTGVIKLNGITSGGTTISAPTTGSNITYVLPSTAGTAYMVLNTDNSGNLSWTNISDIYRVNANAYAITGGAQFTFSGYNPLSPIPPLYAFNNNFKGSGATTVSRTDATTITISSVDTNTTYDFNASSATGGANLNLVGSDSTTDTVKLSNGGHITATYTSATEVTLGSDATDANTASTIVARDASGNFSAGSITLAGDIAVNGGDITTTSSIANLFDTAGNIFIGSANAGGSIYLGDGTSAVSINMSGSVALDGRSTTTTSTNTYTSIAQVVLITTTRTSMKVVVNMIDNVTGEVGTAEMLLLKKSSPATGYITTYAEIYSATPLATFDASVSGSTLQLLVTPASTNSTTITTVRTSLA